MRVMEMQRPDHRALLHYLASGDFLLGEHLGRWALVGVEWPHATITVSAAERPGGPAGYALRFNCEGYPHLAVTGRLWDVEANAPLSAIRWPRGDGRVAAVFRTDWKNGACLYLPCDRQSFEGHVHWRNEHPSLIWNPQKGLGLYLEAVHELLNSSDYAGVRGG